MKSTSAFTLFETMVAIAIICIVLAMSLPAFRHFYQRADADTVRLTLLRTLDFARQESQARYAPVVLCKSNNQRSCSGNWKDGLLVFIDRDQDGVVHDKDEIIQIVQGKPRAGNIYLRSFPIYRDFLVFPAAGLTDYDNATFWYCNDGNHSPAWAVVMSKTGKIHTRYPGVDGTIKDSAGSVLSCDT